MIDHRRPVDEDGVIWRGRHGCLTILTLDAGWRRNDEDQHRRATMGCPGPGRMPVGPSARRSAPSGLRIGCTAITRSDPAASRSPAFVPVLAASLGLAGHGRARSTSKPPITRPTSRNAGASPARSKFTDVTAFPHRRGRDPALHRPLIQAPSASARRFAAWREPAGSNFSTDPREGTSYADRHRSHDFADDH